MLIIRDQNYGTNEDTGVTVNSASDAMKLAAQQVREAIAGGLLLINKFKIGALYEPRFLCDILSYAVFNNI